MDRLIPRLIASVRTGAPIVLSRGGQPRLNPIHIDDLVELLVQCVAGAGDGVINLAGPTPVSIRDIAAIAGRALGREPVFVARDEGVPGDLVADTTRMRAAFRVPELIEPSVGITDLALHGGESPQA